MSTFKLTQLRADVLHILERADKPLKAYNILAELRKVRPKAQPPTVYRVLEFLKLHNVVHEITHQHSYALCQSDCEQHIQHTNILFVCQKCDHVDEACGDKVLKALVPITKKHHFQPNNSTLELLGFCQHCQQ